MKNYRYAPFILSIIVLVLSIVMASNKTQPTINNDATNNQVNIEQIRGVWVSYITLDMQNSEKTEEAFTQKINDIVKTSKKHGFNTLFVQVRPFSDALYNSKYYPWSHILTSTQGVNPGYDPLRIICDICKENNMGIHAWINPYRVKSKESPDTLTQDHPYVLDNSIGFELDSCIYLDPSSEKAQKLIVNGIAEIVRNYDINGIQFDDYFYPENSDSVDQARYEEYAKSTNSPMTKQQWRAENVNTLIRQVYAEIKNINSNVIFGISPQGNLGNNASLGADIQTWCKKERYIDYICPQIYFSLDNPALTFEDSLDEWLKIEKHNKLKLMVGLAGYKGGTDEDSGTWLDNDDILKTEIEICENKSIDGIVLYSYESFTDETNSAEIDNVAKHLNGITE